MIEILAGLIVSLSIVTNILLYKSLVNSVKEVAMWKKQAGRASDQFKKLALRYTPKDR